MIHDYNFGTACSFTGHRPEKLPWRSNESDPRCVALKEKLIDAIRSVYSSGISHFICGMAKGCDMYFAEAVIALRDEYSDITLEAAVPCPTQSHGWGSADRQRYNYILHQCDHVELVQHEFTPDCMMLRNKYMVDHSNVLIAVYDGTVGGTMGTVNYATRQGLEIIRIEP